MRPRARKGSRRENDKAPPHLRESEFERPPRRGADMDGKGEAPFRRPSPDVVVLYGVHAVREALLVRKRKLLTLYATRSAAARIAQDAAAAGLEPTIVEAHDLSRRLGKEAVHQGLLLEARPLPRADIADMKTESGITLVLDQITDPHNVGAILRTAGAFAVDAVIVAERSCPELSGVVAKAASGALEHVTIVTVVNLARALHELSERGHTLIGLDSQGPRSFAAYPLTKPVALVLGAEGKGLRRLTRERCDVLARLETPGAIKSLNVSNACAVALSLLHSKLG